MTAPGTKALVLPSSTRVEGPARMMEVGPGMMAEPKAKRWEKVEGMVKARARAKGKERPTVEALRRRV